MEKRTYLYDDDLTKYGEVQSLDRQPSKNFQQAVFSKVDKDLKGLDLAVSLYQALNEMVVFDDLFEAFGQDLSITFLSDIYEQDIDKINLSNNKVICKSWAELYTFFLNKSGIEAVVARGGVHHNVILKASNKLMKADATTMIFADDKSSMTDLTRCKLKIKPYGFNIFNKEDNGVIFSNVMDSDILDEKVNISKKEFSTHIKEVLDVLKDKNLEVPLTDEIKDPIIDKFTMFHNLLLYDKPDIIGGITYLNSLIRIYCTEEEQSHMTYEYLRRKEKGKYQYYEHLNFGDEEHFHKNDYHFHQDVNGINIMYNGNGLQIFSKTKAKKLQVENDTLDEEISEKHMK